MHFVLTVLLIGAGTLYLVVPLGNRWIGIGLALLFDGLVVRRFAFPLRRRRRRILSWLRVVFALWAAAGCFVTVGSVLLHTAQGWLFATIGAAWGWMFTWMLIDSIRQPQRFTSSEEAASASPADALN